MILITPSKHCTLDPARTWIIKQLATETAVAIIHTDIVRATDAGQITALVLLDLSVAFDTVDRGVLLDMLSSRFDVTDWVFE